MIERDEMEEEITTLSTKGWPKIVIAPQKYKKFYINLDAPEFQELESVQFTIEGEKIDVLFQDFLEMIVAYHRRKLME